MLFFPRNGYIEKYNLLIEFDGQQHFRSTEHWGGHDAYIQRQVRDVSKDKYTISNKINLIRIPFSITPQCLVTFLTRCIQIISTGTLLYISYPVYIEHVINETHTCYVWPISHK